MKQRILTFLLALLSVSLCGNAWGQNDGFDVSGDESNYTYENSVLKITGTGVTVKNNNIGISTNDRIIISGGQENSPIEVTLDGVNIVGPTKETFDGYPAMEVSENSYVKLILSGENFLKGSECSFVSTAALSLRSKTCLEITGEGKLIANAKNIGIGGDALKNEIPSDGYSITISGGKIDVNTTYSGKSVAIGGYGKDIRININKGEITTSTSAAFGSYEAWGIGGANGTINISGGIINTSKAGCGIGGKNSVINITGGDININTSNGGQVGLGSTDKSSNITITGGYIIIDNSLSSTGNAHGTSIQAKSLSTGEKGNAIVIAKSSNIKNKDVVLESKDIYNWNMILLEYPKIISNKEIDVEGYVYGNVSLDQDFIIKDDYSLIIDPESELELNGHTVTNNGRIYFAYEKQNLKEFISTGNGNKHYQVFYDLNAEYIPEELKDGIRRNEYIESDKKIEKKEMYSSEQGTFLFAKNGDKVTLKWKDDVRQLPLPLYNGWILKSFKVKKTKTGENIPVESFTFTMPDESITIYDIQLEKKKYKIKTISPIPKGFEIFYENGNGEKITESVWGEDVYVVISAPGYDDLTVNSVKYQSSIFGSATTDTEELVNKYKFQMPKFDTTVKVDGEAENQKVFNLTVVDPENGEINVTYGEGVEKDELHYKDLIKVTTKPSEGYKLQTLIYTYMENDKKKVMPIVNGEFTMPAADVTVSAIFEKIKYKVITSVADEGMGTVSGSGDYAEGDNVTLTATPNEGYEFDSWKVVDGPDSYTADGNIIEFTMPAKDVTITAKFKETEIPGGVPVSYNDLYIIKSEGAKLLSRYDKKRTPDGGSFTLSLEKEEGYEDCEPTVYYKRGRFGEWKELKLDEVSGYYQIRSVYTDIYVKVSGDGIWPVSNEEVEAQEVKVYTQNGAIIVSTPSLVDVQIISMTGSVVAADKVAGQREFRNLAEGVYIVRVGDKIVKVRL